MVDYIKLKKEIEALTDGVPYLISNLSNISACINEHLPNINWVGFYLKENDELILGPFQGKSACIRIPIGKGVCGKAAEQGKILLVPNVHEFDGHIACDSASNSEIVIPIMKNGELFGVLDIDSPIKGRFTEDDRSGLLLVASAIEKMLSK